MTFDEALSALLATFGMRVEVHQLESGNVPHLVASFGGTLKGGSLDDRLRSRGVGEAEQIETAGHEGCETPFAPAARQLLD